MKHIPTYALYGESVDQAEWLHVETIPSRSRLHGFHIGQHRHENLLQVMLLTAGSATAHLDDLTTKLTPGSAVLVPTMVVHEYVFSPDVDGVVVTLFASDVRALGFTFERPIVSRDSADLTDLIGQITDELEAPGLHHGSVLKALVTLLMVRLQRAQVETVKPVDQPTRAFALVNAFRELVEKDYRSTRNVGPYAEQLAISHTHLNRVCQRVLSLTAQDVINRRVATEARRYLIFSDLPVKMIASELGFDDPAYFARFVTRHLGRSPLAVRAQRQTGDVKS